MPIVLGLAAAFAYGLSDFVAGILSRRVHYSLVALIGNGVACLATIVALLATTASTPSTQALAWGAASGIGSGLGTLVLFRGLSRGRMGVVAPLSALGAAAIPVVIGVILGDRPSVTSWAGVGLALPAIWLVSTSSEPADQTGPSTNAPASKPRRPIASGSIEGLFAGLCFALLFVGLDFAGEGSGLWPVVAGQATGVLIPGIFLAGTVSRLGGVRMVRRDAALITAVGMLGAAAVIAYFLSTQGGLLSIVAVLTSLYPAVTVLLAWIVLHEAMARRQAVGLVLAGVAVALIVLG